MKFRALLAAGLIALAAAPAFAQEATTAPQVVDNCGVQITYSQPPQRAVTMNQSATEIMLALGLQDHMVGTAYLDDVILPDFEAAYKSVPVLAAEYPAKEVLFGVDPDFVYGSYSSAFGDDAAGPREQLLKLGISSYVSPMACADRSLRPQKVTIDDVFGEIRDIGRIFGVEDRAEALIARQQAELDAVTTAREAASTGAPITIFWYDSGTDQPYAGACCGAPGMIMALVGATNSFDDAPGSWADVNWEDAVARDPDVIVLVNASWDTAQSKIDLLTSNPAYASLRAVKNQRWVIIDFSYTSPNVRNVAAVRKLAEYLYPGLLPATPDVTPEATAVSG